MFWGYVLNYKFVPTPKRAIVSGGDSFIAARICEQRNIFSAERPPSSIKIGPEVVFRSMRIDDR